MPRSLHLTDNLQHLMMSNWFCLFVDLWVLPFPLEDCSVFGNFVITLIWSSTKWTSSSSHELVRDSSAVRRLFFLLEPWDVRELYIRKTADLPLQLLAGTFPRFVAIGFDFLTWLILPGPLRIKLFAYILLWDKECVFSFTFLSLRPNKFLIDLKQSSIHF